MYYFEARYYNPRVSVWYGVDPLADKMIEWCPDAGDNWEIYYFGTNLQFSESDHNIISEKFDGFRRNNVAKDFRQQREIRDLKSENKPSILDIYKKPKR